MPDTPTPWVGVAALVAMFVLPFRPPGCLTAHGQSGTGRNGISVVTATLPGRTGIPA
jgi:hypothetical protein